jgi:hypothetical protein
MKLILIILTFFCFSISQAKTCQDLFKKEIPKTSTLDSTALDNISIAFDFLSKDFELVVEKEDFVAFTEQKSSLKALMTINKAKNGYLSSLIYHYFLKYFSNYESIPSDKFDSLNDLIVKYSENYAHFESLWTLIKDYKKPKTSYQAKSKLIGFLKYHNAFFSLALGKEINLLNENELLDFFDVKTREDLISRVEENYIQYGIISEKIKERLSQSKNTQNLKANRSLRNILDELLIYFFNSTDAIPFSKNDLGFYNRNGSLDEVSKLIKMLHLRPEREEHYFNDLKQIQSLAEYFNNKVGQLHGFHMLIFEKAAEEAHGKFLFLHGRSNSKGIFDTRSYLHLKILIENSEIIRAIAEQNMEEYLNKSDAINFRIDEALNAVAQIEITSDKLKDALIDLNKKITELKINDFNLDIEEIQKNLFSLEMQIDQIREEVSQKLRNEAIENYADLNSRWQRLIADRTYNLKGIDYKKVSFSKEVIDFFSNDPVMGARYLSVLAKSYVAIKKESGLRRLPTIHPDMRDIKLIRSHGKVRIVGRLVGDTIYFFHIYNSEKAYDNKNMERIINNF